MLSPLSPSTSREGLGSIKWLNAFALCRCLRILGNVMVLVVIGCIGFIYYSVIVLTYGPIMFKGRILPALGAGVVVLAFSILVALLLWSYVACVVTDPGRVPPGWHPFLDEAQARLELQRMGYRDYYFDRRDPRRPRYCKRCQVWKPERAHHCSMAGHCVLRMDHYCVWVVNTVGLLNYKQFLLFLFYTLLAALTTLALLIKPLVAAFKSSSSDGEGGGGGIGGGGTRAPLLFISIVVSGAFAASLAGFLIMHLRLIAAGCTTIDYYEKERIHPWPYNRGLKKNFEEVFGKQRWRWLLPLHGKAERQAMLDACLNNRPLLASTAHRPSAAV